MGLLPTKKTPPKSKLSDMCITIYGEWKIGKSTLCSKAPNVLFLETEPGLDRLYVNKVQIDNWETFEAAVEEILQGNHDFKTIVIDTADAMYRWCCEWACRKYGKSYVGDIGVGTGWAIVNNKIEGVIRRLKASPYGLFLTSHISTMDVKLRTGDYKRTVPSLPGKSRELVLGLSDIILYGQIVEVDEVVDGHKTGNKKEVRVLRTRSSMYYEAGQRGDEEFILPLRDPLPFSYDALDKAFKESCSKLLSCQ